MEASTANFKPKGLWPMPGPQTSPFVRGLRTSAASFHAPWRQLLVVTCNSRRNSRLCMGPVGYVPAWALAYVPLCACQPWVALLLSMYQRDLSTLLQAPVQEVIDLEDFDAWEVPPASFRGLEFCG